MNFLWEKSVARPLRWLVPCSGECARVRHGGFYDRSSVYPVIFVLSPSPSLTSDWYHISWFKMANNRRRGPRGGSRNECDLQDVEREDGLRRQVRLLEERFARFEALEHDDSCHSSKQETTATCILVLPTQNCSDATNVKASNTLPLNARIRELSLSWRRHLMKRKISKLLSPCMMKMWKRKT